MKLRFFLSRATNDLYVFNNDARWLDDCCAEVMRVSHLKEEGYDGLAIDGFTGWRTENKREIEWGEVPRKYQHCLLDPDTRIIIDIHTDIAKKIKAEVVQQYGTTPSEKSGLFNSTSNKVIRKLISFEYNGRVYQTEEAAIEAMHIDRLSTACPDVSQDNITKLYQLTKSILNAK